MKISPPPTPKRPPKIPVRKPAMTNHIDANGRESGYGDQHVSPNIEHLRLCTKVWMELDGEFVIGEGGAELLALIAKHASLSKAAKEVGWSYRHAWGYVKNAERALGCSLAEAVPGKGTRRGMRLTPDGQRLLSTLIDARNALTMR